MGKANRKQWTVMWVAIALIAVPGLTHADPPQPRQVVDPAASAEERLELKVRTQSVPPLREVAEAVAQFQATDPDAPFSYFNGYVDNFATTPKASIPDYARPWLEAFELPAIAQTPRKLAAPVEGRPPRPAQNLDANRTIELPFLSEEKLPSPVPGVVNRGAGRRP